MSNFFQNSIEIQFFNRAILASLIQDFLLLFNSIYWNLCWFTQRPSFVHLAYLWGTSQCPHHCLISWRSENLSFQAMVGVNWLSEFHWNLIFYNFATFLSLMKDFLPLLNSLCWLLWYLIQTPIFGFLAYFWGTPQCLDRCLNSSISENSPLQVMVSVNWLS